MGGGAGSYCLSWPFGRRHWRVSRSASFLWKNLSWKAWIVGGIWMIVGIAFGAWKTRGFRGDLVDFELPPEEA